MRERFNFNTKFTRLLVLVPAMLTGCEETQISQASPEIELIQPASGTKSTVVTLYGKGFSTDPNEVTVSFGGVPAEIIAATTNSIVTRVKSGASTGNVIVKIRDMETQGPLFTYTEAGESFAYAGTGLEGVENGDSTVARFAYPWGADIDLEGNIYIADRGNHLIRKISSAGVVSILAGTGKPGFNNGSATEAAFNDPVDVAVDANGNVYVSDFLNTCIRKISPAGVVSTYAGINGGAGNTDGALADAKFAGPAGLTFDSKSNLYIADFFNHRIRKITPSGVVSTLAGSSAGCDNGTGAAAKFNAPFSVAVDKNDNVYVTDGLNHSVRKITPAGTVTRIAGTCSAGYKDGNAMTAMFNTPVGIALDDEDNIIVSDGFNNRLRKIYPATSNVETVAGQSVDGSALGIGQNASFSLPADLVHLNNDVFLLVDFNNHRVVKVVVN